MRTLVDGYLNYISSVRRYSLRTREIYSDILTRYLDFVVPEPERQRTSAGSCNHADISGSGGVDAETVAGLFNRTTVRNYEVYLIEERHEGPRTVSQHLSVLSGFAKFLMRCHLLTSNPVALVSRPKIPKRLPAFYAKDDILNYLDASSYAADPENLEFMENGGEVSRAMYEKRLRRLIVLMLFCTGIRRSELIGLRVGDLDRGREVIHVRGKGDKMREIPLLPMLSEEILLYLQSTVLMFGCVRQASEPLLVTAAGKALYPMFVERAVKTELGEVGNVPGKKSPHVLRHTVATQLLDDGADLNSIKELLGHSSLAATQVYTHNSIEKLKSVYLNAHPRAKRGGKYGD